MPASPRNPNFSLARNYIQLQNSDASPAVQQALTQVQQQVYDLRDAISYPSVLKWRTLDLNDTTVGNDIAHATVFHPGGMPMLLAGVLRVAITATLTVRLNASTPTASNAIAMISIPANQPINTPVLVTNFTMSMITDQTVLTWDVLASDGSTNANGVASFTLWWQ